MAILQRLNAPAIPSRSDAGATRARVRNTPVYRDLRRLVDLCAEVQELAADIAADLPGSPLASLLPDGGRPTAGNLHVLAGVIETYADLIDGDLPAL